MSFVEKNNQNSNYSLHCRWMVALLILLHGMLAAQVNRPPTYMVKNNAPQGPGFYFLTALKPVANSTITTEPYYNMILDKNGELLYFKRFPGTFRTCDFKLQPNGKMSYFSRDKFYIMNQDFNVVDSVYCKNGLQTDNHELLFLPNGHYALLGVETSTVNLSPYKVFNHMKSAGSTTALVLSGVIQEQDAEKNVVFEWHSKDHFDFMDVDTFFISDPTKVDWTHFNALHADKDGNYIVSVRHFSEITKIKRADSSIIWRMGGLKNQFQFINDPKSFTGQHDVRRIANGNISLFDNGRDQGELHPATAKEYRIHEKKHTATLVWKLVNDPEAHSVKGLGNVQRLSEGNTLINYGTSNSSTVLFNIHTTAGKNIFEISFSDTLRSYRVYHSPKLPWALKRPTITFIVKNGKQFLSAENGYSSYQWNTGARTQTIEVTQPGSYCVWVPAGKGGLTSSLFFTVKKPTH
ncbi:MAG: aryl-sulfate sulfotransferase [bacterium]|nr:aryl-sulfate sulfotransferase [bacterium]